MDQARENEILYRRYVERKVDKGMQQIRQGQGIPHEQAMKELRKHLSKLRVRQL